jgi:hypothetical protein
MHHCTRRLTATYCYRQHRFVEGDENFVCRLCNDICKKNDVAMDEIAARSDGAHGRRVDRRLQCALLN